MSGMVEIRVSRLGLDATTNTHVVILTEADGGRFLPIWIGQAEAESILLEINGVHKERPMTHDLCKSLILGLGARLARVNITKVEDRTYFAELSLVREGEVFRVDARPSDSIAIALRTGSPVFVDESLLLEPPDESEAPEPEEADAPPVSELPSSAGELSAEQLKQYLSGLRPEDFGKFRP